MVGRSPKVMSAISALPASVVEELVNAVADHLQAGVGGLAVVDEQRHRHRLGRGLDLQDFAADVVLANGEVVRRQPGDRFALVVEDADVDVGRLRLGGRGRRNEARQDDRKRAHPVCHAEPGASGDRV